MKKCEVYFFLNIFYPSICSQIDIELKYNQGKCK